jgi:hypothetical protein
LPKPVEPAIAQKPLKKTLQANAPGLISRAEQNGAIPEKITAPRAIVWVTITKDIWNLWRGHDPIVLQVILHCDPNWPRFSKAGLFRLRWLS